MSSTPEDPEGLSASLAGVVLRDETVVRLLELIVKITVAALDGIDDVSVTVRRPRGRGWETATATSDAVAKVDNSQYDTQKGPCVEAVLTGVETAATLPTARWEEFSTAAAEAGYQRVWSVPLTVQQGAAGALNMYSRRPEGADAAAMRIARVLAGQAGTVLANAADLAAALEQNSHLLIAMEHRTVIGQAQGVLIAREGIDPDAAFDIMRRASQRTNTKLSTVAAEIVAAATGAGGRSDDR